MSKYMIVASLTNGKNTKLAYRCFTDNLNDKLKSIHDKLDDTQAEIAVYRPLYGDMDENMMLPEVKIYTDISAFKDSILDIAKEKVC